MNKIVILHVKADVTVFTSFSFTNEGLDKTQQNKKVGVQHLLIYNPLKTRLQISIYNTLKLNRSIQIQS